MCGSDQGRLLVITGAQAAGKTTLGRSVAEMLPRAVHIDGDAIQRFVISGAVPFDLPPPPGAVEQLHLRYAGALAVSRVYRRAGFDTIVTDNIFEEQLSEFLSRAFAEDATDRVYLVMLDPAVDVIWQRYNDRPGGGYTESITPEGLKAAIARTPRLGLRIDTSNQTPAESAAEILRRLDEAAIARDRFDVGNLPGSTGNADDGTLRAVPNPGD